MDVVTPILDHRSFGFSNAGTEGLYKIERPEHLTDGWVLIHSVRK